MQSSLCRYIFLVVLFFSVSVKAQDEIPNAIKTLANWETKANAVAIRNNEPIKITHFEIPLSALETDISPSISKELHASLIFEKKGQRYVRWLINPEDTKYHLLLQTWLEENKLDATRYQYYTALQTASRSYLIYDPQTKQAFSAKVSTNKTGGNWKDKGLPVGDSKEVRATSNLIESVQRRVNFEHSGFMLEPAYFGIPQIDQAMLVRDLSDIANSKTDKFYVPLFSLVHENEGIKIAKLNGYSNPVKFLNEKIMPSMGRAFAELYAHVGISYDSGHGQNFMIELDGNKKATGKIIFKDFADAYVSQDYYENAYRSKFMSDFTKDNVINDYFEISFGLLHGNNPPTWINKENYAILNKTLFKNMWEEFSKITMISLKSLPIAEKLTFASGGLGYVTASVETNNNFKNKFFALADCLQGAFRTKAGILCPDHLLNKNLKREFYPKYLEDLEVLEHLDQGKLCSENLH